MRRVFFSLSVLALLVLVGVAAPPAVAEPAAQEQRIHVVAPGETLFRLALRYNTTINAIASANGIRNVNLIFTGQRLVIPGDGGTTPPPDNGTPPPGGTTEYRVVPGDTLSALARRFNTTIQAIAQLNNIQNVNLIFSGQILQLPGGGTTPPTPPPGNGDDGGTPPQPPPVTGGFELGGHVFSFAFPEQMRGAGMTWAKYQVRWSQGEPPSIAQDEINNARSRGFKVLLGIVGDPGQLAANPTQYYQDFAQFLGGVAALGPDAIEVWNEQNIDREWPAGQINGANYAEMLAAAYPAIKNANSSVLVISGAPAPTGFFGGQVTPNGGDDAPYLQQMRAAGAGSFFDCLGIHYNEGVLPPTASSGDPRGNSSHYTRYYPTMVSTYRSIFPEKPLCFTEIGYLTPEGLGPLPAGFEWAANTTIQDQAEWLAQAVDIARTSGNVRLFIIWNVDSTFYGADPQAGYAIVRGNQCLACITVGAAMGVQ